MPAELRVSAEPCPILRNDGRRAHSRKVAGESPLIRNTLVVDQFNAEGLRGRDLYLDSPRTLVQEYEYNWASTDSILTLEDIAPFKTVTEDRLTLR